MKAIFGVALAAAVLAGCNSPGGEASYGAMQAQDGAALRFEARDVVGILNPICPYVTDEAQLARYDAPRARYDKIKEWVDGKPLATDIASVEADYAYYWQRNQATCGEPDTPENLEALERDMAVLDEKLGNMEKLAGMM